MLWPNASGRADRKKTERRQAEEGDGTASHLGCLELLQDPVKCTPEMDKYICKHYSPMPAAGHTGTKINDKVVGTIL